MDHNIIGTDPHKAAGLAAVVPDYSRRLILTASLCGALAGLISWGVGESAVLVAPAKREHFTAAGHQIFEPTPETKLAADQITSARVNAVFGGLLGLFLGMAGGIARRSIGAGLVAAVAGSGLGAGTGALAAFFVLPVYSRHLLFDGGDLLASLIMHGCLWTGIGAAGGLALGLGLGGSQRTLKAALAGALGAIGGVVLFEFLGATLFPYDETGLPTSATARTRLLARLLVAVAAAVAAALASGASSPITSATTTGSPSDSGGGAVAHGSE
jgi:hypothetical protein